MFLQNRMTIWVIHRLCIEEREQGIEQEVVTAESMCFAGCLNKISADFCFVENHLFSIELNYTKL